MSKLVRNARAICAVETDDELASHSRGLIILLADALEAAAKRESDLQAKLAVAVEALNWIAAEFQYPVDIASEALAKVRSDP